MSVPDGEIRSHADALASQLTEWRRRLHMHPELSFKEKETTDLIEQTLRGWGLEPVRKTPTGLWADIAGGAASDGSPRVAIRADIDALPIREANTFDFKSRNDGVMHACGHDGHTSILLGVTRTLLDMRDQIPGNIRLLFQPAEESPPGGAQQLIAAGALEGVDRVIGLHLWSLVPTGHAGILAGPMMAAADQFIIKVTGRGGHGAQPHLTVDALACAAQIAVSLQQVVSRMVDPIRPAVVTIGTFKSGSNFNIIAQEAQLTGTVRTFHPEVQARIKEAMDGIVRNVGAAFGATAELDYQDGYPALVNDADVVGVVEDAVRAQLGDDGLVETEPFMGGEDFAYYGHERPAAFLFLGAQNAAEGAKFPHHHPSFTVDEASLPLGVAVLASTAWRLLDGGKAGASSASPALAGERAVR